MRVSKISSKILKKNSFFRINLKSPELEIKNEGKKFKKTKKDSKIRQNHSKRTLIGTWMDMDNEDNRTTTRIKITGNPSTKTV